VLKCSAACRRSYKRVLNNSSVFCHAPNARSRRSIAAIRISIYEVAWSVQRGNCDSIRSCAEMRSACDTCTVDCARNMQSHKGSHRCNITADDADNGESPRLQYCFSCCSQQECAKQCEVYQLPECQQARSVAGGTLFVERVL